LPPPARAAIVSFAAIKSATLEQRRRLAILVAVALALLAFVVGVVSGSGSSDGVDDAESAAADLPQLPRGGRVLLPDYRLVAYYGAPGSDELGALGIGSPGKATDKLIDQAEPYGSDARPVMPVLELLASVASAAPGEDGLYRIQTPESTIRRYLRVARNHQALLLLDIQPGRSSFAQEAARLDRFLREPDVGLALDPEWHVGPDEIPGQVIGSVDADTVNRISANLAAETTQAELPQKLFVVHQFTVGMIQNRDELIARPALANVINVDGFGDPPSKVHKYKDLYPPTDSGFFAGLKLFYSEDTDLMSPDRVLNIDPAPDLIVYE
jgi:hypothetical protein